ncbi:zeta toxin family protein [Luteibacter sp.]|uniref:zeta toxin family protein n=1 Tax=Luteibacter sp. TaxID=1886636 RepID=UPI003F81195D
MTDPSGKLSDARHAAIYRDRIVPDSGFNEATTQSNPRAIILAGQPGAGKGRIQAISMRDLSDDAVSVDPDELRAYHPDVRSFRSNHPYTWSTDTHADASSWASELREQVIDARKNLIIDTTLAHDAWAIRTISQLRNAGYDVEVRAVATHRLESEHGVDNRFSASIDERGYGRYVPSEVRRSVYERLAGNLDTVHAATNAPIRIYEREGNLAWDSVRDPGTPGEALERIRGDRVATLSQTRGLLTDWSRQSAWHASLTDRSATDLKLSPDAKLNLLAERAQLSVVESVGAYQAEAEGLHGDVVLRHRGYAARGLGTLGGAAMAYDAIATANDVSALQSAGNVMGAQSAVLHFGGRVVGVVEGAELGAATGAALGVESGPGLFVTGTIGGIAGAIGGEKIATAADNYRTYNQTDHTGQSWHMDPTRPDQGWTRSETRIDPNGLSVPGFGFSAPAYKTRTITAPPEIANELNYKASGVQVQLALAHPPAPRDPYSIKAAPTDTPSLREANWQRDAGTHAWSRSVTTGYMEHGLPVTRTELASPDRTRELERASSQVAEENRANRPEAIAGKYRDAYLRYGWSHFGDPEEAAMKALHAPKDVLQASDGNEYKRGPDGAWKHEGWFGHESRATGNLRDELNEAARSNGIHAPSTKQDAPSSPAHDRINEMLEAARNGDWNRFRQETQAFADMPPGQQLQQNAVQQANQIEQHAEQQRAAQLQQQQNEQQQTQQQAHGPRMVR